MKPSIIYNPLNPKDPYYSKDFQDMITEQFIKPLAKLGIKLIENHSISNEDHGIHILDFKRDLSIETRKSWITDITNTEDDGFTSQGIIYFDTVYLTIAFTC